MLWKRSKKGALHNRCAISIHPFGLCVYEEIASGTYKSVWFDAIENISYCVAEPLHRHVFVWIARAQQSNDLECHVALCKTSKRARVLAELLAKAFHDSYLYRQQQYQQRRVELSPSLSGRCSVCDSISRQQSHANRSSFRHRPHQHYAYDEDDGELEDRRRADDYENISFQVPMVARAFVQNYEGNSMNNSSHRSLEYDVTLTDDERLDPVEYYRRAIV